MSEFSFKIYGCRGSFPVSGNECVAFGGATSCVVVRAGEREIVLDAGSGITSYGQELSQRGADPHVYLFLTHAHFDHIIGLPYFAPIYRPDATVEVWGPRNSKYGSIGDTLAEFLSPPFHPVPIFEMLSRKHFHDMSESTVVYFLKDEEHPVTLVPSHPEDRERVPDAESIDLEVHCMRGYNHPKSGVNLYKVVSGEHSLVYATDTEGYVNGDRRLINFASGADILIHDAMYTEERYVSMPVPTQGHGHSTVEIACALARTAAVDKLILFHHDPASTDEYLAQVEEDARELFENAIMARDGLEMTL